MRKNGLRERGEGERRREGDDGVGRFVYRKTGGGEGWGNRTVVNGICLKEVEPERQEGSRQKMFWTYGANEDGSGSRKCWGYDNWEGTPKIAGRGGRV
jgi:hypothetical protein